MTDPFDVKSRPPLERDASGEPVKLAVLLIDLQNDYCHPDGAFSRLAGLTLEDPDALVENTNRLVAAARNNGHEVIWVRMAWDSEAEMGLLRHGFLSEEGLRAGTWGTQLLDGLDVQPQDAQVRKTRFSAFFKTPLEEELRSRGIRGLVVGGVRTDYCVESTVRAAFFRDIESWVVRDCVAGYFSDLHDHSLVEMDSIFAHVVGLDDAVGLLERLAPPVPLP